MSSASHPTHDPNPEEIMDPKTNPPDKLQQIKDAALTLLPPGVRPDDPVVTYHMPWVSERKREGDALRVAWTCRVTVADVNAAPQWGPEKFEAILFGYGDWRPSTDQCLDALLVQVRLRVSQEREALLARAGAMAPFIEW